MWRKSEGLNEWLAPSSVWRWLKVTTRDWQLIQKKRREDGGKMRSEEQKQKPQPLIWVIAQKFGSQKTCTSCCFSNAKMVSFMGRHRENLSKWMWNTALIKSESWQTWLNRKMCCISTPWKYSTFCCSELDADWNTKCLNGPAANHVSDHSHCASALLCICPERCKNDAGATSTTPTTVYYPCDFFAVFTAKCHITLGCMLFLSAVVKGGSLCLLILFPLH